MDPQITTIHPITCLALLFMLIFIYYTLHYRKQYSSSQNRQIRLNHQEGYPFFTPPFQPRPEIRNQGLYMGDLPSRRLVKNSFQGNDLQKENEIRKNFAVHNNSEKETPSWNKLIAQQQQSQQANFPKVINVPWEQRAFVIDRRNDYVDHKKDGFKTKERKEDDFYLYNLMNEPSEKDSSNANYLMPNLNPKAYKSTREHTEGHTLFQENNRIQKPVSNVIERFDLGLSRLKPGDKSQQDILNIESISRIASDQNTTINVPQFLLEGFGTTCVSLEYPSRSDSLSNQNNRRDAPHRGGKICFQEDIVYHTGFGTFGKEAKKKGRDSNTLNKEEDDLNALNREAAQSLKKRKWDNNKNDVLEDSKRPQQNSGRPVKINFENLENSVDNITCAENQKLENNIEQPGLKKVKQNDMPYDHSKVKLAFASTNPNVMNNLHTRLNLKSKWGNINIPQKETINKIIHGMGTEANIKHKDLEEYKFQEDRKEATKEYKLDDRFVSSRKKKRHCSPETDKKINNQALVEDKTQDLQKQLTYQKSNPKQDEMCLENLISTKETTRTRKGGALSKIEAEWDVILEKIEEDLDNSVSENLNKDIKREFAPQNFTLSKKEIVNNDQMHLEGTQQSKQKEKLNSKIGQISNIEFNQIPDEDDISSIDRFDIIKKYKFDDIIMFTPSKDLMNQNGECEDMPLTELVEQACSKDSI